jgi:hypothetical protein
MQEQEGFSCLSFGKVCKMQKDFSRLLLACLHSGSGYDTHYCLAFLILRHFLFKCSNLYHSSTPDACLWPDGRKREAKECSEDHQLTSPDNCGYNDTETISILYHA